MDSWGDCQDVLQHDVEFYGEQRNASTQPRGQRFEDSAPDRLLRIAARSGKAVRHV
jgi:hypothetical protein